MVVQSRHFGTFSWRGNTAICLIMHRNLFPNTLRLRQHGCHFRDNIFQFTFLCENVSVINAILQLDTSEENFSEIWIKICKFPFKKIYLKCHLPKKWPLYFVWTSLCFLRASLFRVEIWPVSGIQVSRGWGFSWWGEVDCRVQLHFETDTEKKNQGTDSI